MLVGLRPYFSAINIEANPVKDILSLAIDNQGKIQSPFKVKKGDDVMDVERVSVTDAGSAEQELTLFGKVNGNQDIWVERTNGDGEAINSLDLVV